MERTPLRFLVVGAGGVGGVLAARLVECGYEVVTWTRSAVLREMIRTRGYELRTGTGDRLVRGFATTDPPSGTFDFVLLTTQPKDVEEAARRAMPFKDPDGALVCLQNGLCEERVARIASADDTFGAVVGWGASSPAPGVFVETARGGFTIGRVDGRRDPRLFDLASALGRVGETEITENLAGKRWSKLALNCAISTIGTLGGDRLGTLMRHRFVRRLALDTMSEVVKVARAEGVTLEKVAGTLDLDWISLTHEERRAKLAASLGLKHALLLAVGVRFRRLRSSMLAGLERGEAPSVDFLNGEVVTRAARHGVDVAVNERLRESVWAVSRGEATPSVALVRAIYDATGPRGSVTRAA
ncbi:MAG: 2-dehydropantoate 2-reductase [Polyangiaceae bacterium]